MGRRLAVLAVLIGASLGGYFAWSGLSTPPEEDPNDPRETKYWPVSSAAVPVITGVDLLQRELVGTFAVAPLQPFVAAFPWQPLEYVAAKDGFPFENLLQANPLRFLEMCAERFDQDVQGYTCIFVKKERIEGKLYPPGKTDYEVIKVACREQPFSVFFDWQKHRKLASRALYVQGENKDKILARGAGVLAALGIQQRALNDADAKRSGRYLMSEFGMGLAIKRTVKAMQAARARGELHVRYEGQVKLDELDGRVCYKFVRTPYRPVEEDGLNELTLYIDCENWLQVGSILRDPEGRLIAEYFFRDVEINPTFPENQFTRAAL